MSTSNIFNEIDHRLSTVKRWTIIHTIRQQSVAEHSFNVAVIADRIAKKWFGITSPRTLYEIQEWAREHDRPEALSSDIPTIVKDLFSERKLFSRYGDMLSMCVAPNDNVAYIVKLADRIDAIVFLLMEISLGNKTVTGVYQQVEEDLLLRLTEPPLIAVVVSITAEYLTWRDSMFPDQQFFTNHYDRRERAPVADLKPTDYDEYIPF